MRNKLYLDPMGGIAGDMFTAAFLDAGLIQLNVLQETIASFDSSIQLIHEKSMQSHISGSHFRVITRQGEEHYADVNHAHEHYPFGLIKHRLLTSTLPKPVLKLALNIFTTLAMAEAKLHNKTLDEISFHEVGTDDAIADIIAAATCVCNLEETDIYCGPIPLGNGEITFSHGSFNLPAPATAEILKGIPVIAGKGHYEMTTPTGSAIIKNICHTFVTDLPCMQIKTIGYGHGHFQPPHFANSLRLFYGSSVNLCTNLDLDFDEIIELTCNVDDQPGNLLAPCVERFIQAGAIDVFYSTYQGKKGRQGQQWTILATPEHEQFFARMMLEELQTIGLRINKKYRYKLFREMLTYPINGDTFVAKKVFGANICRIYPETEEVLRFSQLWKLSLSETWNRLNFAIQSYDATLNN